MHEQNPVDVFSQELIALAHKHGLTGDGLDYRMDDMEGVGHPKKKLALPARSRLREFLRAELTEFFRVIRDEHLLRRNIEVAKEGIRFGLSYDATVQGLSGGYASYDVPQAIDDNTLWNSLREKAKKFREVKTSAARGIIVCDGGLALLSRSSISLNNITTEQIASAFLRKTSSVDVVLLITGLPP